MHKQIIHFGQDLKKEEFYNLIVKVNDIDSENLSDIKDEIFKRGFTIYHIDEYQIEAAYKDRYQKVLDKYREIESNGWKAGE